VEVSSIQVGSTAGVVTPDPSSPLADAQGNVLTSDVSLSGQLVGMVAAQNDYQANATVLGEAKTAYQSALTLGQ
jgi:flagellar basal-body rod protein FlgC